MDSPRSVRHGEAVASGPSEQEEPIHPVREHQCSVCQRSWSGAHAVSPGTATYLVPHHASLESFQAACASGCDVCNVLWQEFKYKAVDLDATLFPLYYGVNGTDLITEVSSGFPTSISFYGRSNPSDPEQSSKRITVPLLLTNTPEELQDRRSMYPSPQIDPLLEIGTDRAKFNIPELSGRLPSKATGISALTLEPSSYGAENVKMAASTGSDETLVLCRAWIAECVEKHDICNNISRRRSSGIRKRLLDLQGLEQDIPTLQLGRLDEWADVCYAALSHRWGSEKPLVMTSENEATLTAGILLSELPQMFQQAVHVAVQLKIHYIWIDSLCIMQDSKEDWLEQAGNMGNIYQNAVVTIAATAAEDSTKAIFRERTPLAIMPARITLVWCNLPPHSDLPEANSPVRVRMKDCLVTSPNVRDKVDKSLLSSRGWIFQERLLSSRILHFTDTQVYFECHCSGACEAFPLGWPYMGSPASPFKRYIHRLNEFIVPEGKVSEMEEHMDQKHQGPCEVSKSSRLSRVYSRVYSRVGESLKRHAKTKGSRKQDLNPPQAASTSPPPTKLDMTSLYAAWTDIVDTYSVCNFTKPEDRLIALRSAMQTMLSVANASDIYLEGHWLSRLPNDLLWFAGEKLPGALDTGEAKGYLARRPKDKTSQIAPTWSWASVIGGVRMFHVAYDPMHSESMVTLAWMRGMGFCPSLGGMGDVLDVQIEPTDKGDQHGGSFIRVPITLSSAGETITPESLRAALSLDYRCVSLDIEGYLIPADIRALLDPAYLDPPVIQGWAVKFQFGSHGQNGDKATVGGETFSFGTTLIPDDVDDFYNRIAPDLLNNNFKGNLKFHVLPLVVMNFWEFRPCGLVLEEVDERDVRGQDDQATAAASSSEDSSATRPRSFKRIGMWTGENMADREKRWEGFRKNILACEIAVVRLY